MKLARKKVNVRSIQGKGCHLRTGQSNTAIFAQVTYCCVTKHPRLTFQGICDLGRAVHSASPGVGPACGLTGVCVGGGASGCPGDSAEVVAGTPVRPLWVAGSQGGPLWTWGGPELCCTVCPHLGSLSPPPRPPTPRGGLLLSTGWKSHPEAKGEN